MRYDRTAEFNPKAPSWVRPSQRNTYSLERIRQLEARIDRRLEASMAQADEFHGKSLSRESLTERGAREIHAGPQAGGVRFQDGSTLVPRESKPLQDALRRLNPKLQPSFTWEAPNRV